ncbi:RidA family protein [Pseudomonas sp. Je.1.5.c]|uniref:RidA family protein n=1 Tax=Pseudomonas sp. Je.1.5.c TaxID=3142839 RepID=UPI003DA89039
MPSNPSVAVKSLWSPVPVKALPAPHFRYSPIVRSGPFLFISGMVGLDPETGGLVKGGLEIETRTIFHNLQKACDELAIQAQQLMLVRVYCSDFSAFGDFNGVWNEFFKDVTPPARTSIGVSALPLGAVIEMEFQFAIE